MSDFPSSGYIIGTNDPRRRSGRLANVIFSDIDGSVKELMSVNMCCGRYRDLRQTDTHLNPDARLTGYMFLFDNAPGSDNRIVPYLNYDYPKTSADFDGNATIGRGLTSTYAHFDIDIQYAYSMAALSRKHY